MMWRARLLRALFTFAAASLAGACASTGGAPHVETPIQPRPWAFDDYALVGTALALRGAPYRNGGADPQGFDCSGFTQYVFAQHGVAAPRTVDELSRAGTTV